MRDSLFFRALCEELHRSLDGERHLHRVVGEEIETVTREYDTSRQVDTLTGTPPLRRETIRRRRLTDSTCEAGRVRQTEHRIRAYRAAAPDGGQHLPAGGGRNRPHDGPASRPHLVAARPVHRRTAGRGLWLLQIIQTPLKQQSNGKKQSYRKSLRESSENGRSLRPDRGRAHAGRERIARSPDGSRHGTRCREGGGTEVVGPRSSGRDVRFPAGLRIR